MALFFCPVGFLEVIIAVFLLKKSQTDTKNDKNSKIFNFSKFLRIFRQIFERLRKLERQKRSKGENVLPSRLF